MKFAVLTSLCSVIVATAAVYVFVQRSNRPDPTPARPAPSIESAIPKTAAAVPIQKRQQPQSEDETALVRQAEELSPAEQWAQRMNVPVDEAEWMLVSFEERERLFRGEGRDNEWAREMEREIAEKIREWDQPPVQLLSAECRVTMCRIATYWPSNPSLQSLGQQGSTLYQLGLDHQGETYGIEEGNGYLNVVIARRR